MINQTSGLQKVDLLSLFGAAEESVFASIAHLEKTYPGFDVWLHSKVLPGMRDGSRRVRAAFGNGHVLGVAIAKRTDEERKLCTLWVDPCARTFGIASDLANEAFDWLGTDKPLFTVPDTRLAEFRPLLSRWGFKETQVAEGAYRIGRPEYVFNGLLQRIS